MAERDEGTKVTPEIVEAAKQASSVDDIIGLAQEHGIELTAEGGASGVRARTRDRYGRPERPRPNCGSGDHAIRYTIENLSCNDHVYWCNSCNNYFTVTEFDGGVSVY